MTLVSLRPTATLASSGTSGVFGSLADDSDATFVTFSAVLTATADYSLTDLTLPASAVVKWVTPRARYAKVSSSSSATVTVYPGVYPAQAGAGPGVGTGVIVGTAATATTISGTTRTNWTDTDCDNAWARVMAVGTGPNYKFYEFYFDVRYVVIPTLTVDAPTGTVTDTNEPLVSWTNTLDTDGGSQTDYEVKIYSAAQYGAGGFSADTSTPTATSGHLTGSNVSWQDTAILANATYRAYVRTGQTVNGTTLWSAWTFGGFVVNVAIPAVPTVVVTAQNATARIKIDVGVSNLIPNPSIETNTTGWANTATGLNAGATISQDATVHQSGTKSLKIVTTAGSATQGAAAALPELEAGVPYTLSAYLKGNAGAEPLSIAVLTSAGATLPTSSGSAILTPLSPAVTTALQRYTLTFTPSATTAGANFVTYDNGAAVRTWFIDAVMLASNTAVAPTYDDGGPATTDRLELQRSIDSGTTWLPVRNSYGNDGIVNVTGATIYDYEAPNGTAASYRIRALHSYSGVYAASDWSASASATWSSTDWWLKHPNLPALNLQLTTAMLSYADVQHAARQGVFQPLGATLPIVVSDSRGGATGTIVFLLSTAVLQNALDAILDAADTFLLQGPVADGQPDRYVRIGDHASVRIVDKSWAKATTETLPWVEVASPPGAQS